MKNKKMKNLLKKNQRKVTIVFLIIIIFFVIFIIPIFSLILFGSPYWAGIVMGKIQGAECSEDSECTLVPSGCCSCSSAGRNTAMPSKYAKLHKWLSNIACMGKGCLAMVSNHPSCSGTPVCRNNKCEVALPNEKIIEFETMVKGFSAQEGRISSLTITSRNEWQSFWRSELNQSTKLPEVDFSKEMIIPVFNWQWSVEGEEIEVKKIIETSDRLLVYIERTQPEGVKSFFEIVGPYHFVKIRKSDKEIQFERSDKPFTKSYIFREYYLLAIRSAFDSDYCRESSDCRGSIEGNKYAGRICGKTDCINEFSDRYNLLYLFGSCHYSHPTNYASKGGRCECINNKCTALEPINFIDVAKEHCKEKGLKLCNDCNFYTPRGWGISLIDWKKNGFNCKLDPSVGNGLKLYVYNPCGCGDCEKTFDCVLEPSPGVKVQVKKPCGCEHSECENQNEETFYFLFDEVIAEMIAERDTGKIYSNCFLGTGNSN